MNGIPETFFLFSSLSLRSSDSARSYGSDKYSYGFPMVTSGYPYPDPFLGGLVTTFLGFGVISFLKTSVLTCFRDTAFLIMGHCCSIVPQCDPFPDGFGGTDDGLNGVEEIFFFPSKILFLLLNTTRSE